MKLKDLLTPLTSIGFSGSRTPTHAAQTAIARLLLLVPSDCRISVGCANGIDEIVRSHFENEPRVLIFRASDRRFSEGVYYVAALARRSAACARSVRKGSKGLLVALPTGQCPPKVKPSKSFSGSGSGTWGTIAYAAGIGRSVLVHTKDTLPAWKGCKWQPVEGDWYLLDRQPEPVQLSLF